LRTTEVSSPTKRTVTSASFGTAVEGRVLQGKLTDTDELRLDAQALIGALIDDGFEGFQHIGREEIRAACRRRRFRRP
jgi:hypothetical protein